MTRVYSRHFNNIHAPPRFHTYQKITLEVKTSVYWLEHLYFPSTFSYVSLIYVTSVENIHPITFRKYTKRPIKVILKNQHVL